MKLGLKGKAGFQWELLQTAVRYTFLFMGILRLILVLGMLYVCLGIIHGLKCEDYKSMLVHSRTLQVSSRHSRKLSRPSQL